MIGVSLTQVKEIGKTRKTMDMNLDIWNSAEIIDLGI